MQDRLSSSQQLDVLFSFAHQLIHQTTLDDLLWYTAEEVVARLGFIDCVIYAYDAEREVLVQAAAIGGKTDGHRQIINPLIIPLEEGVTGECARTRKPIVLPDAAAHPKYVADNIQPGSEAAVPILAGDELYGVIDCEHPVKASFRDEHVMLLKSVSALVASQWKQCLLIARLQEAEQRALAASDAKSVFLQNMSHEMRTPLNGVLGGAQLLKTVSLGDDGVRYLDIVHSSANLMLNLVDNVLDITAIEAGATALRPVDLDLTIFFANIQSMFSARAREKGLVLTIDCDLEAGDCFCTDEGALTKLTVNLIGNALKYTDEGEIRVIVRLEPQQLNVRVHDTGCGLAPDEQDKVFERFSRTERSRRNQIEGTGVGLSLCRDLIRQLDGEIGVHSEPEIGSVFWFILPELERPEPQPVAELPPELRH